MEGALQTLGNPKNVNVVDAIKNRKSTRAFLTKPVPEEKIRRMLETARHAPSGANAQPWQVAVVSGNAKRDLESAIEQSVRRGDKPNMDYQYYPIEWKEPYSARRMMTGLKLYKALGIKRNDATARQEQWRANYRAFDAPVMLLFFMDACMQTGSYLDYGMFIQSIMLAALEEGLATCPQASLAEYPEIVKNNLGYPANSIMLCGLAVGYEDQAAKVNNYRTARVEVEDFTRFFT